MQGLPLHEMDIKSNAICFCGLNFRQARVDGVGWVSSTLESGLSSTPESGLS